MSALPRVEIPANSRTHLGAHSGCIQAVSHSSCAASSSSPHRLRKHQHVPVRIHDFEFAGDSLLPALLDNTRALLWLSDDPALRRTAGKIIASGSIEGSARFWH